MLKITKNTVKSIIRKKGNIDLLIIPCKLNPNSPWISSQKIEIKSLEELEKFINEFTYYNCNNETGLYPSYYM